MTLITRSTIRRANSFLINHLMKDGFIADYEKQASYRWLTEQDSGISINKEFQSVIKFRQIPKEEFNGQEAKLTMMGESINAVSSDDDLDDFVNTDSSRFLIINNIFDDEDTDDEDTEDNSIVAFLNNHLGLKDIYKQPDNVILSLEVENAFTDEEWQKILSLSKEELINKLDETCAVMDRRIENIDEIPKRYTVEILTKAQANLVALNNAVFIRTIFTHIDISNTRYLNNNNQDTGLINNNFFLREINVTNLDISSTEYIDDLFRENDYLRKVIGLETLNVEHIISAKKMFSGCSSLKEIDTTGWRFHEVKNLDEMFAGCRKLKRILGLSEWNPVKLESLSYTFSTINNIEEIDLSGWKHLHLKSMIGSFHMCTADRIILPDLSYVTEHCILESMQSLFESCIAKKIENLNTTNFDNYKKNKKQFKYQDMFRQSFITDINFMQGFDIMKVFKFDNMVRGIADLTSRIIFSNKIDVTYWRKFMTDQEIEEAAMKLNYYVSKKNDEEIIIARLGEQA